MKKHQINILTYKNNKKKQTNHIKQLQNEKNKIIKTNTEILK